MVSWIIRAQMAEIDVQRRYAGHPTIFSIRMHHGGEFTKFPGRNYVKGKETYVDLLDIDTFSVHDVDDIAEQLGYYEEGTILYYHFQSPTSDLDFGLFALGNDDDIRYLATFVSKYKLIEVYIEHGKTQLHTYTMSPNKSKIRIEEISENPARRLLLGWYQTDTGGGSSSIAQGHEKNNPPNVYLQTDTGGGSSSIAQGHEKNNPPNVDLQNINPSTEFENTFVGNDSGHESGHESCDESGHESGDELSDTDDSDYLVDYDNLIQDVNVEVDMNEFNANIDEDAEWVGGTNNNVIHEENQPTETGVLNNEILLSGSSSDEGPVSQRKKSIKVIQRAIEKDAAKVTTDPFYVLQTFTSANEFKEKVKLHSIETRRELELEKNDKNRVRYVCKGSIPNMGDIARGGTSQENVNNEAPSKCTWVLYASKWKNDVNWMVKTYVKEHRCLQTRKVKACTYKFLSKQIVQEVDSNPTVPIKALRENLQRKFQVGLSKMKVFRAKNVALNQLRGDFAGQYTLLRDYVLELQSRNPETTVKIEVENEPHVASETRTFRRIYICLGPLKKGFAAGKRDLLGLDGAFMKGPYPGQILSTVGLDGNNGTYPLAYAVVESENTNSWTWFLTCLGDDLGLHTKSNFTFVTDRQKGVLPAIARLFPCAEHRYCLRHIHENMNKSWKGKEFKDALWKCATRTTVQQFHAAMEELRQLNKDAYEWLRNIPPQHWARSHFTGRAHSDVLLNNMCESFNSKIIDGRDVPILSTLEYIREYIMTKIVTVQNEIAKASGPLTPTASVLLEHLKSAATRVRAVFCGNGKYQVTGSLVDQYVVDMHQQSCSCRKWELTGIPCKHAIAAIWEMRKNKEDVRIPESWVHPVYWLQTWKEMYSFTVEPLNGRNMWEKSTCPTTLLPPKYHVPIGRPKKKRKKSAMELQDLVKDNRVSRAQKSVTCSKCNNIGHNARSCKGQPLNVGGVGRETGQASNVGGGGRETGQASNVRKKGKNVA